MAILTARTWLVEAEEHIRCGNWELAEESVRAARTAVESESAVHSSIPFARGGLTPRQMKRLAAYVEEHLSAAITLADLANVARLSRSHFCRKFRESFGQSPQAYVQKLRVSRAQSLMLQTDQPLAVIALDCGLTDQAALCTVFRRLTGESPGAWRRCRQT